MDDFEKIPEKEKEDIFVDRLLGAYKWMTMEYEISANTITKGFNRFRQELCERLNKDGDEHFKGENYD